MKIPTADEHMFAGPLGEIVNALDDYTEASKVGVLASLLGAFSAYLGQSTKVHTGKGRTPLTFWPVLVGHTGIGRKGTATNIAMEVVQSAWRAWSDTVVQGCPATGLGFVSELAERSNSDGNGDSSPTLIIEEEMDTFISNAKKDTRVGVYLRKAWDGTDLRHKTSKDHLIVRKPHVSIVGHVQPRNWGAISGSKDATGGTYNRFLPLAVERSKVLPVFGGPDPTDVVRNQARTLRRVAAYAREVELVTVELDVAAAFEGRHRPACEALIAGTEELAQMSERAMAYLVRLAALYALADSRDQIDVPDFDAALALVRYSVETVVAVLPETGGDRLTSKIADAVRLHGPLTKSELWDAVGRNHSARDIDKALLAIPQIKVTRGASTGGRHPHIYQWVETNEEDE